MSSQLMRTRSTLLKPAASLMLGASALFGCSVANAGRIIRNVSAGLALSLPLAAAWVQPAQAVLIYNFYESGSDLVVEGTGSLNLPLSAIINLPLPTFTTGALQLGGKSEGLAIGQFNPTTAVYGFYNVSGPTTLGTGLSGGGAASSGSGIASIFDWDSSYFIIDNTYASGTTINSRSVFSGISLASLGMTTAGTLGTWALSDPSDPTYISDTISVQVTTSASSASVPGPLPILGLAAAFGFSRKLRKRIKLHKDTGDTSTSPGA